MARGRRRGGSCGPSGRLIQADAFLALLLCTALQPRAADAARCARSPASMSIRTSFAAGVPPDLRGQGRVCRQGHSAQMASAEWSRRGAQASRLVRKGCPCHFSIECAARRAPRPAPPQFLAATSSPTKLRPPHKKALRELSSAQRPRQPLEEAPTERSTPAPARRPAPACALADLVFAEKTLFQDLFNDGSESAPEYSEITEITAGIFNP